MFSRLINWWHERSAWRAAHDASWKEALSRGADGLTQFQHQALSAFQVVAGNAPLEIKGESERHLTGSVPGSTAVVFIYEDGAEVSGGAKDLRAEQWDYQSPQELIEEFAATVTACAQSNQPLHPDVLTRAGERRRSATENTHANCP